MKLTDIQENIEGMSDEDLRKAILHIRKDRRVSKVSKSKKVRKAQASKLDKLRDMVKKMTPEQKAALLEKMGG